MKVFWENNYIVLVQASFRPPFVFSGGIRAPKRAPATGARKGRPNPARPAVTLDTSNNFNRRIPGDISLKTAALIVVLVEHPVRVHGLVRTDFLKQPVVLFVDAFHLLRMRVV